MLLLDDLVKQGSALWFDRSQRGALILWRGIPEWAELIYRWARGCGFEDSVVTVDEMQVGQGGGGASPTLLELEEKENKFFLR